MCRYAAFTAVPMITMTIVLATISTSSAMLLGKDAAPKQQLSTFIDFVERAGYIAEEHDVVTEDGYILYMHRIPGGPKSPVAHGKSPILLIHGLLGSSDNWVLQGPEYDLAYLLVDSGYDVWVPNARGNFCGRRHKNISIEDPKFWQFSWHEIGVYDIAASIDRVLAVTDMRKVSLVGYSLGGTATYVLLSMRPEYNEIVNVAFVFGSVAIVTHALPGSIVNAFLRYGDKLESLLRYIGISDIFPRGSLDIAIAEHCQNPVVQPACRAIVFYLVGVNTDDKVSLPDFVKYLHGTSLRTLLHFKQIVESGKFRRYDFGKTGNYKQYGSSIPPEYPLEEITAPMVLYYAPNDLYTTKQDVEALLKKIRSAVSREVPDAEFGHLDFIIRPTARTLIYDELLRVLDGYTQQARDK